MNIKIPKIKIPANVSRAICRSGFKIKKASPEILLGTGIVGGIVATVMACKATTKASEILDKAKTDIETIHDVAESEQFKDKYNEEDFKKDLTITYVKTGVDLVKTYAPSVLVGAVSIGCVLAGHNIIRQRNIALTAAFSTVLKDFNDYRGRLVERFGEDLDKELRFNVKAKEIEEVVTHEDGTTEVVKSIVNVADPNTNSDYTFFFDDGCRGWTKDAETNFLVAKSIQQHMNMKLQLEGVVLLNDVREAFGLPKTRAGCVVGWIYDENNPTGDNFIDLGIFNQDNERARAFVNGFERVLKIDPNVDGYIYDLIS